MDPMVAVTTLRGLELRGIHFGGPSTSHTTKPWWQSTCDRKLWEIAGSFRRFNKLSAFEAGFLLGVATSRGGDGLVGGHAYNILDLREIRGLSVGVQSRVTDRRKRPRKTTK
jgi:hypothetical protein